MGKAQVEPSVIFRVKNTSFCSASNHQPLAHPPEVRREGPCTIQIPVDKTKPLFMNILSLENKWLEHLLVNNEKNSSVTTQMNEFFKGMKYVRHFNPASVFTPPHNNCRETPGL